MSRVRRRREHLGWLAALLLGCGGTTAAVPPHSSDDPSVAVGLRLTEAPSEGSVPQTRIVLVVIDPSLGRATTPVGVFTGPCVHDIPMPEAIVTARCWWADDEATISVVREGDEVVAKVSESTEPETARARASLPVSIGASVVPIGPGPNL